MLMYKRAQGRPQHRKASPSSEKALYSPLGNLQTHGPLGTNFALGSRTTFHCLFFWLPHFPYQSLILNSMGSVVTEDTEDLKNAFRVVSGSTLAGGLDEMAEFTL